MRLLTTILLLWPITVIGDTSPDALPPWGVWKCEAEAGVDCEWEDHSKLPECELVLGEDLKGSTLYLDLESFRFAFYEIGKGKDKGARLHYIGPQDGVWAMVSEITWLGGYVIVMSPSKRTFTLTRFKTPTDRSYALGEGICTNITPKEPEKPTEGEAKEEAPSKD
jgi:hypothetical protein